MAERNYFSAPKDVTGELWSQARTMPGAFVAMLLVWFIVAALTVRLGAVCQLLAAILLVAIAAYYCPKLLDQRRKIAPVLRLGKVERQNQIVEDRLEQVTTSSVEPASVIERKSIDLSGLFELRVVANSVWVGSIERGAQVIFLSESDFADDASRRAFIDLLLGRMRPIPPLDDDDSYDPLIPKH